MKGFYKIYSLNYKIIFSKNEVKNGIKAKAIICTENSCEKKELILFYGIIDIFQNYSLRKQLKQKLLERKQGVSYLKINCL